MTGTPTATDLSPDEDLVDVIRTGTQSTGTEIGAPVDLAPGTYLMICFFPDISDGFSRAYHGMYTVLEVAG